MKPKYLKSLLLSEIKSVTARSAEFCVNSGKDFIRKRKLPFETVIKTVIGMESKILAVDGSDIQIATNPNDLSSFHPGANGQKPYNLLHLNALYDLNQHIYTDAVIQGRMNLNEHSALQEMVDNSDIPKARVIADRGYESYNNMAHIQEKGWFFLIRIKDGKTGIKEALELPSNDEFDEKISLKLTRRQNKETKDLLKDKNNYRFIPSAVTFDYLPKRSRKHDPLEFYEINFRVVRFKVTDNLYETVLTNLSPKEYPPATLKKMYALRWGIETSFRDLKYTIGMLDFHSKKVMCILQEIYAHMIMYNFAEMITSHVVIEKSKENIHTKPIFQSQFICVDCSIKEKQHHLIWKPLSQEISYPYEPIDTVNGSYQQKYFMVSYIE